MDAAKEKTDDEKGLKRKRDADEEESADDREHFYNISHRPKRHLFDGANVGTPIVTASGTNPAESQFENWPLVNSFPEKTDWNVKVLSDYPPANTCLPDWWRVKAIDNHNEPGKNYKYDFNGRGKVRSRNRPTGRAAKAAHPDTKQLHFEIRDGRKYHGDEGAQHGLIVKQKVRDGLGDLCPIQEDYIPDDAEVLGEQPADQNKNRSKKESLTIEKNAKKEVKVEEKPDSRSNSDDSDGCTCTKDRDLIG